MQKTYKYIGLFLTIFSLNACKEVINHTFKTDNWKYSCGSNAGFSSYNVYRVKEFHKPNEAKCLVYGKYSIKILYRGLENKSECKKYVENLDECKNKDMIREKD